jgi:hypothetical protein
MSVLSGEELRHLGNLLRKLGIAAAQEDGMPDLAGSEDEAQLTA